MSVHVMSTLDWFSYVRPPNKGETKLSFFSNSTVNPVTIC